MVHKIRAYDTRCDHNGKRSVIGSNVTTKKEARERASYGFGLLMGICLAVDAKIIFEYLKPMRAFLLKKIDRSDLSDK